MYSDAAPSGGLPKRALRLARKLMDLAMTNEERFVASCEREGEVGVRQNLKAGRYSEGRIIWASNWLKEVEGPKSDATKAEERA